LKRWICVLAAFLVFAAASASAAGWGMETAEPPYTLEVIPLQEAADISGNIRYVEGAAAAQAGTRILFALRLGVGENAPAALVALEAENAGIGGALQAAAPQEPGLYYMDAGGRFTKEFAVRHAYCTGTPRITARLGATQKAEHAGLYAIEREGRDFLFTHNGRGMRFCTDAQGRVYAAYVFGPDYRHRLTAALLAENGEHAAVARTLLKTLSMDEGQLLSGGVYMNEAMLTARFGAFAQANASYAWTALPMEQAQPGISGCPVAEVPATGAADELLMCALILLLGAMMLYDRRRLR